MGESGSEIFVKSIYENTKRPPRIILYGLPTCSRCKTAKLMLDHRNIKYESLDATDATRELPYLDIDGVIYEGKEALLEIRKLKQ